MFIANNTAQRPNSAQNVFNTYETNASPISYHSPNQGTQGQVQSPLINRLTKSSPTPAQTAWTLRQVRFHKIIHLINIFL